MSWDVRKTQLICAVAFGLIAFNFGRYVDQAFDALDGRTWFGLVAWGFGTIVFGWLLINVLRKGEADG